MKMWVKSSHWLIGDDDCMTSYKIPNHIYDDVVFNPSDIKKNCRKNTLHISCKTLWFAPKNDF